MRDGAQITSEGGCGIDEETHQSARGKCWVSISTALAELEPLKVRTPLWGTVLTPRHSVTRKPWGLFDWDHFPSTTAQRTVALEDL